MKRFAFPMIVIAAALAGCGSDSASYMVGGNRENAFSLFRDKSYPGADWELAMVLTHLPECQRRHKLKPASSSQPYKAELYRNPDGSHLLHSANAWYDARLTGCELLELKSAPASRGDLVGTWEERERGFNFFPVRQ